MPPADCAVEAVEGTQREAGPEGEFQDPHDQAGDCDGLEQVCRVPDWGADAEPGRGDLEAERGDLAVDEGGIQRPPGKEKGGEEDDRSQD